MTRWHISQTREHVQRLYGPRQRELVAPCLNSVVERKYFAAFHYQEATRLLREFRDAHLVDVSLLQVLFGKDEGPRERFNQVMFEAGAHVLACVQSIHALADILAHAVYYSFGMNLRKPSIAEASIGTVALLNLPTWKADEQQVKALLSEGANSRNFTHIAALSNRGKHSSIVRPTLSENWTDDVAEPHELRFPAFTHKGVTYPQTAAAVLLESEYNRWSKLVVDVGNGINCALAARAP